MNVREMVEDYLKDHGYGGLVNTEIPCGCIIGDLAPCGEECLNLEECDAGYVHYCELCPLAVRGADDRLESNGCDVEDHPGEGDYCVGIHMEVHPREPDPPPEPWITDAKLQDTVEFKFYHAVATVNEEVEWVGTEKGVVKVIYPDHHCLKVLVTGRDKLLTVLPVNFIRIVKSIDFMEILTMPDESEA